MTTETGSGDAIIREWLLVKVGDMPYEQKVNFARNVYCKVNSTEKVKKCKDCKEGEGHRADWARNEKVIVVRADLVEDNKNNYAMVIPVYAETEEDIENILNAIHALAEKPYMVQIDRLRVAEHMPHIPHSAHGYVTAEEENPLPKAPIDKDNGHNPW